MIVTTLFIINDFVHLGTHTNLIISIVLNKHLEITWIFLRKIFFSNKCFGWYCTTWAHNPTWIANINISIIWIVWLNYHWAILFANLPKCVNLTLTCSFYRIFPIAINCLRVSFMWVFILRYVVILTLIHLVGSD